MSGLDADTLERKEQLLEASFGAMGIRARKRLPRRDVSTSRRLHVATSPRRDVSTSRRLHVATLQRRDVSSRSAPYHLKYEWFRKGGNREGTNEGTEFQSRVTRTSRKCPGFVLSFIVWLFSDIRMAFLILNTFFFSFIMF